MVAAMRSAYPNTETTGRVANRNDNKLSSCRYFDDV